MLSFKRKFYAAANSICANTKYASEITKLFLMESYCLPLMTYGCEALNLSRYQIQQLNVCWSNVYRRIFHYNSWESVKELQFWCGHLDFKHIYFKRKLTFVRKMRELFNPVVQTCFTAFQLFAEFYNLKKLFN